jgi:valyl-tRNA synthetase
MDRTFHLKEEKNSNSTSYSILLSPPQESEALQMANALTFTVADILGRRKQMQGFKTLCFHCFGPGDMPAPSVELASRLGLMPDWNRMPLIPENQKSAAVTDFFVQLYREGKIYLHYRQWFLRAVRITKAAVEAIKKKEIAFIPEGWTVVYGNWLSNLRDWCISRPKGQGDRIPAYHCRQCHHMMVEAEIPGVCSQCGSNHFEQDAAVLDTWFSSVLRLLTAAGRPQPEEEAAAFYPLSLMTADVPGVFSWGGRVIVMALALGRVVPFREVLINGLIRDDRGHKMSPCKNNIISPGALIETYGPDPLRFSLAIQAAPARDISFSIGRIKGYRALINKIHHACRYVLMNLKEEENVNIDFSQLSSTDKWVLHALNNTIVKVNDLMDNYRLHKATHLLYHFFRHEYCNWYLEFSKTDLSNPGTRKTLRFTLYRLLQLLHPFMPFITETLYRQFKIESPSLLRQTRFPTFDSRLVFSPEFARVEVLKKISAETRRTRARNNIPPHKPIPIYLKTGSAKEGEILTSHIKYFDFLTRSRKTGIVPDFSHLPRGFRGSCPNWEILLLFNSNKERLKELDRLKKVLGKVEPHIHRLEKKLSNERFLSKTPQIEVLHLKKSLQENLDRRHRLRNTIDDLS